MEQLNETISDVLEADIAVVGGGSAGLASALTASENGARVILIEKMPFAGGFSLFAEGMFAVESPLQKKSYIKITAEEAFKSHMRFTHWRSAPRLVSSFIRKSADTIAWLMAHGVGFESVNTLWPDGPRTWHMMAGGGKALVQTLVERLKEGNVTILTETAVKKLNLGIDGVITGLLARKKNGDTLQVDAKAVVIAGGSYANNKKMVETFGNVKCEATPILDMRQTGDSMTMAWDIGADPNGIGPMLGIPAVVGEKPDSHLWAAAFQPSLWVNNKGARFCDESIGFQFPFAGNALAQQNEGVMYTIFDESLKEKMINDGVEVSLGVFVPVSTKLERLEKDLERGIETGKAVAAHSIEELAKKIDIEPSALKATFTEYNRMAENNLDDCFAKTRDYMNPLEHKPFYAVRSSYHIFTTFGGIKVNYKTEVLDGHDEVIPGLFAVGNCAGGLYANDYDIFSPGGALGFAVNSGRIAGDVSAEYVKDLKSDS